MTPEQALLQTLADVMTQRDAAQERIKELERDIEQYRQQHHRDNRDYITRLLRDLTGLNWKESYSGGWSCEIDGQFAYKFNVINHGSFCHARWWRGHVDRVMVEGRGRTDAEAIMDMVMKRAEKSEGDDEPA